MTNRIKNIFVHRDRLDPSCAELSFSVYPERVTNGTQVRGRMTGPHCAYATTVEVAYPLRECSREYYKYGTPHISSRAVIPEPNLWDPVSPFLYRCTLELWQGDQCCDRAERTVHLEQFSLGPSGLIWNGRPLTLRGVERSNSLEAEASELRQAGYNTILTSIAPDNNGSWDIADRLGFLMIGRVGGRKEVGLAGKVRENASCLGWLVTPEYLNDELLRVGAETVLGTDGKLVGLELAASPQGPIPKVVSFVACEESALPSLADLELPKLILRREKTAHATEAKEQTRQAWILGWVE
jgi:hypothetical protein